ncbi:MAG: phosphomannomutase/phosphoglucomutase, partial [Candidatus Nanopelagicaceae bacterium]
LAKSPGAKIIYNLICSRAVPEVIEESGGIGVRSRVGHSFIKKLMAENRAIFGGEHSGHFYFEKFWNADSGMLAALYAIAALKATRKSMSQILTDFDRYFQSGEINSKVDDVESAMKQVLARFPEPSHRHDRLDGLTVEPVDSADWWFNVRASNTEPLLRLNVEAKDEANMAEIRDQVLALIR